MMHETRLVFVLLVVSILSGCLATTPVGAQKNVDQLPMYGGLDRQSVPELKAADEKLIADTTIEKGDHNNRKR